MVPLRPQASFRSPRWQTPAAQQPAQLSGLQPHSRLAVHTIAWAVQFWQARPECPQERWSVPGTHCPSWQHPSQVSAGKMHSVASGAVAAAGAGDTAEELVLPPCVGDPPVPVPWPPLFPWPLALPLLWPLALPLPGLAQAMLLPAGGWIATALASRIPRNPRRDTSLVSERASPSKRSASTRLLPRQPQLPPAPPQTKLQTCDSSPASTSTLPSASTRSLSA